jgi:hypothetical protein
VIGTGLGEGALNSRGAAVRVLVPIQLYNLLAGNANAFTKDFYRFDRLIGS